LAVARVRRPAVERRVAAFGVLILLVWLLPMRIASSLDGMCRAGTERQSHPGDESPRPAVEPWAEMRIEIFSGRHLSAFLSVIGVHPPRPRLQA
jgi:hypothetical protein